MPCYHSIGLMSGTSLDGLDIAFCRFEKNRDQWSYQLLQAETIDYPDEWKSRLRGLDRQTAFTLAQADADLGYFMGVQAHAFIQKHKITPDFIASHGHTVFHQPGNLLTAQIGKGATIAAVTGLPVVCDFRSKDVALGGQGAPLVPVGDQLLFPEYDYCLNLGGFANISFDRKGKRIAFDICPCNIVLNDLSKKAGWEYDDRGKMARKGTLLPILFDKLNLLEYYRLSPPKSLGKEWVEQHILPVFRSGQPPDPGTDIRHLLHTFCEHIAFQIGRQTGSNRVKKLLITGGGALNEYLVQRIGFYSKPKIILPDPLTIHFKEALIFAFLGLLRWRNEINCLASVTGAARDHVGGAIYL